MDKTAQLPGVGETWLADFGPDTPLGHFTVETTYHSPSRATFLVTGGAIKGRTETMDYTTTKVRDGLYVVRWTEPEAGAHVTRIEDYTNGTVMVSSVFDGQFIQLHGTWSKAR